mmetsp:Transcript_9356/g.14186  ORF Transcript_9356/g.14186 Transcript_9356/m.14186 type:complete len:99 (+) Transcript_9356:251-547(+)
MDPEKKDMELYNTIIDYTFQVYDFAEYYYVMQRGHYSFPFTLYLPEWLPQSSLAFDFKRPSKSKNPVTSALNTYKVHYQIEAYLLATPEQENPVADDL